MKNQNVMQALDLIKGSSLVDLAPIIEFIAELTFKVRKGNLETNRGGVPKEVFEWLLGMGGVTVSVQIVNEVWSDGHRIGFALKKRDTAESGDKWAGLYHSTCTTFRMGDTVESALERNLKETIPSERPSPSLQLIEHLGSTIHNEPERRSACVTIMHVRQITANEVGTFSGEWKIFSAEDVHNQNPEIIDHNWFLLQWVLDPNRPPFADVRKGWKLIR